MCKNISIITISICYEVSVFEQWKNIDPEILQIHQKEVMIARENWELKYQISSFYYRQWYL